MTTRTGAAATAAMLAAAVTLAGCQPSGDFGAAQNAALDTDDQKASYAIGLQFGSQLAQIEEHLDMAAYVRGVQDAMAEREPVIAQAELQEVMQRFMQTVSEEQEARMQVEGAENEQAGEAFLAENAAKEGVMTTESGLQYEVLREGEGETPGADDRVTIHYRGTLPDGTEFDSSYERGEPTTFQVGSVIAGFTEALQMMRVGSHYRFVIPGNLAYGAQGNPQGGIGPNQTLIFEVELLEISE